MAKSEKKKRRWVFPLILAIYAIVFLGATVYGLGWFWDYIDAYEQSRPHIALNAYMEKLTPEYVCEASGELIATIDPHVQSEESCRQVIMDALSEGITCAKKSKESTEDKQVYALLSGKKVIGSMVMERRGEASFGFVPWQITEDDFDLSFLITEPVTVTVPSNYPVYVNGNLLSRDYITEDHIHHAELEEFYDTYSLPYMVTYQAGPFLGASELQVTDPSGSEVTMDDLKDMSAFISNCTQEETAALNTIADAFIRSYVDFTSCNGGDTGKNYRSLAQYMVPNGELAKRMRSAIDGLYWVSDRGAVLSALNIHHYVSVGDGRYLCDLTYVVDTKNFSGAVQTTSNLKVIFVETENGLKAESMLSY